MAETGGETRLLNGSGFLVNGLRRVGESAMQVGVRDFSLAPSDNELSHSALMNRLTNLLFRV